MDELTIHRHVVAHLRRATPAVAFFHVPNEGKRGPRARSLLHGMGVMPGVPDLIIVTPPRWLPSMPSDWPLADCCGAALELKSERRGAKASPEQTEWLATFAAHGWAVACTRGLDEALQQLRAWGYIDG
jgi:hypothetical protein